MRKTKVKKHLRRVGRHKVRVRSHKRKIKKRSRESLIDAWEKQRGAKLSRELFQRNKERDSFFDAHPNKDLVLLSTAFKRRETSPRELRDLERRIPNFKAEVPVKYTPENFNKFLDYQEILFKGALPGSVVHADRDDIAIGRELHKELGMKGDFLDKKNLFDFDMGLADRTLRKIMNADPEYKHLSR